MSIESRRLGQEVIERNNGGRVVAMIFPRQLNATRRELGRIGGLGQGEGSSPTSIRHLMLGGRALAQQAEIESYPDAAA